MKKRSVHKILCKWVSNSWNMADSRDFHSVMNNAETFRARLRGGNLASVVPAPGMQVFGTVNVDHLEYTARRAGFSVTRIEGTNDIQGTRDTWSFWGLLGIVCVTAMVLWPDEKKHNTNKRGTSF